MVLCTLLPYLSVLLFLNSAVWGRLAHQYTIRGGRLDKNSAAICLLWISCLEVSTAQVSAHTLTHACRVCALAHAPTHTHTEWAVPGFCSVIQHMHRHTVLSAKEQGFNAANRDISSTSSVSPPRHNVALMVKLWRKEKLSARETVNMIKHSPGQQA